MSSRERAFLKTLRGVIVSYRRGPKTQNPKECLLKFPEIETASEAGRLISRKVAWPVGERKCRGKIVATHGKKGVVRARLGSGCPVKPWEARWR